VERSPKGIGIDQLTSEHRELDGLLGGLLAALQSDDLEAARHAIAQFDAALRLHTKKEEEDVFGSRPGRGALASPADDTREARLYRDLALEHVQVRELSGMICRTLSEKSDLEAARHLAANLARRWDSHTTREEREFPAS
jgi:hemerythrin HHE cation binding domain-containing protein